MHSDFWQPCISETASPGAKWTKNGRQGYLVCIQYLWLLSVQVQFGVIRGVSDIHRPWSCCISETANRREKRTKIWASWGKYLVYVEHFWLLSVQVQFGVIRCISDFLGDLISRKPVLVEQNGPKYQPQRCLQSTVHCLVFKVSLGSFGAFQVLTTLYLPLN